MEAITYGRIKIEGGISFTALQELEINIEANQHASAKIKGMVEDIHITSDWANWMQERVVNITFLGEAMEEPPKPSFSGYLMNMMVEDINGSLIATMMIVSGTILLDRSKICRSYQDIGESYVEIVDQAIDVTEKAACIYSVGENRYPKKPIIQYQETNWEFAKRMVSHFGSAVYPEVSQPYPRFWFGYPELHKITELDSVEYQIGISEQFIDLGGTAAGYSKNDFIYYEVSTLQDIELSTGVRFKGQMFRIGRKQVIYRRAVIIFTYLLCNPVVISLKKQYHPYLTGMSLLGTVLSTDKETLKIHLDIDESQEESKAYPYQWIPDTGSVMYCMPQVGTRVSLYFSESNEQSARGVNCVRTNGSSKNGGGTKNSEESDFGMSDPSKRGLHSEDGKKMFLHPDSIGFSEEEAGNFINLEDDIVLTLESSKKFTVETEGKTKLKGKNITVETPVEINLTRG